MAEKSKTKPKKSKKPAKSDEQKEMERMEEEERIQNRIEKIWEDLCKKADYDFKSVDDEFLDRSDLIPRIWIYFKGRIDSLLTEITGQKTVSKRIREEIASRIDDEIYYQEVKYFTEDFKFLAGLPEAGRQSPYGRKFIKFDSDLYKKVVNRYIDLRNTIPLSREELVIRNMLEKPKMDNVTRRILKGRLQVIDRCKYIEENGNIGIALGNVDFGNR